MLPKNIIKFYNTCIVVIKEYDSLKNSMDKIGFFFFSSLFYQDLRLYMGPDCTGLGRRVYYKLLKILFVITNN